MRVNASKKSGVSSVFLENFSIKPGSSQNYVIDPLATTCLQGKPMAPQSRCKILVFYFPQVATPEGQFDSATLELTTNAERTMPPASGGVIDVMLKGKGKPFHRKR